MCRSYFDLVFVTGLFVGYIISAKNDPAESDGVTFHSKSVLHSLLDLKKKAFCIQTLVVVC